MEKNAITCQWEQRTSTNQATQIIAEGTEDRYLYPSLTTTLFTMSNRHSSSEIEIDTKTGDLVIGEFNKLGVAEAVMPSIQEVAKPEKANYSRDPDYYFEDGSIILLVQDVLFKIHASLLKAQSQVFKDMFAMPSGDAASITEGSSEQRPIVIPQVKPPQFRNLLKMIYTPASSGFHASLQSIDTDDPDSGKSAWKSFTFYLDVATLCHRFEINEMEQWARNRFETLISLSIEAVASNASTDPGVLLDAIHLVNYYICVSDHHTGSQDLVPLFRTPRLREYHPSVFGCIFSIFLSEDYPAWEGEPFTKVDRMALFSGQIRLSPIPDLFKADIRSPLFKQPTPLDFRKMIASDPLINQPPCQRRCDQAVREIWLTVFNEDYYEGIGGSGVGVGVSWLSTLARDRVLFTKKALGIQTKCHQNCRMRYIDQLDKDIELVYIRLGGAKLNATDPATNRSTQATKVDSPDIPQSLSAAGYSTRTMPKHQNTGVEEEPSKRVKISGSADAEGVLTKGSSNYSRDPDYYFEDGNTILLIQDVLFKVHRSLLKAQSQVFEDMFTLPSGDTANDVEGTSDEHPIAIPQVKSPRFRNLLKIIYSPASSGFHASLQFNDDKPYSYLDIKAWSDFTFYLDVATLGHRFAMAEMEQWAKGRLTRLLLSYPEVIAFRASADPYTLLDSIEYARIIQDQQLINNTLHLAYYHFSLPELHAGFKDLLSLIRNSNLKERHPSVFGCLFSVFLSEDHTSWEKKPFNKMDRMALFSAHVRLSTIPKSFKANIRSPLFERPKSLPHFRKKFTPDSTNTPPPCINGCDQKILEAWKEEFSEGYYLGVIKDNIIKPFTSLSIIPQLRLHFVQRVRAIGCNQNCHTRYINQLDEDIERVYIQLGDYYREID
ncbi:unnamed protein product [Rhizoctonia solani]|uniref:BTB domain-containing protein n=1 Tax=Rhizoctonia solani TaxID=456999 RepID=A0A8H3HCR1_9AGAM|nr:unnamed protein product [Rhizoctonia solani]